jgi:hypothetical protein
VTHEEFLELIGKKRVKVIKYTQLLSYCEAQDLKMGPKKAYCKGIDLAIYLLIVFISELLFFFFWFLWLRMLEYI